MSRNALHGTNFGTTFSLSGITIPDLSNFMLFAKEEKNGVIMAAKFRDRTSSAEFPTILTIRRGNTERVDKATGKRYPRQYISRHYSFYVEVVDAGTGETTHELQEVVSIIYTESPVFKDGSDIIFANFFLAAMDYHWTGSAWSCTASPLVHANFGSVDGMVLDPVTSPWADLT